jgi:hypothetical protein
MKTPSFSENTTNARLPPVDWSLDRDAETGLWWRSGPGHTAPVAGLDRVRVAGAASARLFYAAETGQWAGLDAPLVLRSLRALQHDAADRLQGCLSWYWEEPGPIDTNAAFFNALSLIPLYKLHAVRMDAESRGLMEALLSGLHTWFTQAVGERTLCYPNKYLGDLVCAWLLGELLDRPDKDGTLAGAMTDAADYWLSRGWGWGEHLSDGYAAVCLWELSLLLLLAERLPEPVRARYHDLLADLMAIEDLYGDGPRVPALRCYAFREVPVRRPFRDRVGPAAPGTAPVFEHMPDLGPLFHRLGWARLAPPPREAARDVRLPCFDEVVATAHIEADIRLGSVSRFPVMPSAEALSWGLSWQCFPVALWRTAGDGWGFLQWEATEAGVTRAHPALDKGRAYLGNALSRAVQPPLVGRTYSLQHGPRLAALRIMTPISLAWTTLIDRFRLVGTPVGTATVEPHGDGEALCIRFPGREVGVRYIDLSTGPRPVRSSDGAELCDWSVVWPAGSLANRRVVLGLWLISLEGDSPREVSVTPVPTAGESCHRAPEEQVLSVRWRWGDGAWSLVIDPLAADPLRMPP